MNYTLVNVCLMNLVIISLLVPNAWADVPAIASSTSCPEEEVRVVAQKQANEGGGMDAESMFQAVYGLCQASQTTDGELKIMWEMYADYHVKVATFKKELDSAPLDQIEKLEENGGRIPSELVIPMRRLGASAMMVITSQSALYSKIVDINIVRFKTCGDDSNDCLKEARAAVENVKASIDNIKLLEPHLITFALLSVVDKDWTCCINMSGGSEK